MRPCNSFATKASSMRPPCWRGLKGFLVLPSASLRAAVSPTATRLTREAIERGAKLIYQAALTKDAWLGYPDFLVRNGDPGATTFEPEDAKLSRSGQRRIRAATRNLCRIAGSAVRHPRARWRDPCRGRRTGAVRSAAHAIYSPATDAQLRTIRRRRETRRLNRNLARPARNVTTRRAARPSGARPTARSSWQASAALRSPSSRRPAFTRSRNWRRFPASAKIDGMGAETLTKLSAQARLQARCPDERPTRFRILAATPAGAASRCSRLPTTAISF